MKNTKKKLYESLNITYILIATIIIGFILASYIIYAGQNKLIMNYEKRYESYLLADELRQSSDDLTRLARTYVITKDEKFKEYYNRVIDIRNGELPRPENYNSIYWDLVITGELEDVYTDSISLLDLMKLSGFSDEELNLLEKSKDNSDDLVITELIAMQAVLGISNKDAELLMQSGEELSDYGIRILFDDDYHMYKSEIMKPIDSFFSVLDKRTKSDVDTSLNNLYTLLIVIGALVLLVVISLIIIFSNINKAVIKSKDNMENQVKLRTIELEATIKELEIAQQNMIESEKMASLGGLVAGLAHEVNTPIGIGVTLSSHLESKMVAFKSKYESGTVTRRELEDNIDLVSESARIIYTNMKRAADLVKSFKQVSVDQSSEEIRKFNMKEYLNIIYDSLKVQFKGYNVKVTINCPDNLIVHSYPGALSQVIHNLLINSYTHGFDCEDEGEIVIEAQSFGDDIKLLYTDTGAGIPDKNIEKIFDPFFTTKRGSGGSGLGLNIVYNIVTQTLKGTINVYSEVGTGTEFEISFPDKISS